MGAGCVAIRPVAPTRATIAAAPTRFPTYESVQFFASCLRLALPYVPAREHERKARLLGWFGHALTIRPRPCGAPGRPGHQQALPSHSGRRRCETPPATHPRTSMTAAGSAQQLPVYSSAPITSTSTSPRGSPKEPATIRCSPGLEAARPADDSRGAPAGSAARACNYCPVRAPGAAHLGMRHRRSKPAGRPC